MFCGAMKSKKNKTPRVAANDNGGRFLAAAAAAVNDDVLTEILLRLPAKSLIRFKSVCKHWLSIISGGQFCRLHTLRRHMPQPSLILCASNLRFFYLNPIINGERTPMMIPYNFNLLNPEILSSCNGLLLLQCDNAETDHYYVYNPTTKQSRKIIVDVNRDCPRIVALNLAFDPSKSPHYKIVCVRESWEREELPSGRLLTIEVYDSHSHTWELRLGPFPHQEDAYFSHGVHCDNSIYWKIYHEVMYFDIDKNVIGYLPNTYDLPAAYSSGGFELQESNGSLYLFDVGHAGVALWELEEGDDHHSQCWFLKCHGHSQCWFGTPSVFNSWGYARVVKFISGLNGDKPSTVVTHVPGKIRAYRFLDKRLVELVDLTNQPFYHNNYLQFRHQRVYQFGEGLAPV